MGARVMSLCAVMFLALFALPIISGCEKPSASTAEQPAADPAKAGIEKTADQGEKMAEQVAPGEEAGATRQEFEELKTELSELRTELRAREAELKSREEQHKAELSKLRDELGSKAVHADIDALVDQFNAAMKTVRERQVELRHSVDQLAKSESKVAPGNSSPAAADRGDKTLADNSRPDLSRVVRKSVSAAPQKGTLHVENKMANSVQIRVNGNEYWVAPGVVTDFILPVGTVTTELVSFEAPQSRTLEAPDYTTTLTIRPKAVTAPTRPIEDL